MAHRTPLTLGAVALIGLAAVAHGQETKPAAPTKEPAATQPATTKPAITDAERQRAIAVINRAVKAMGGKPAIKKIESSHMQAQVSVPISPEPMIFDTYWHRTGKALVRQNVKTPMGEVLVEQGTDGKVGWSHNSMEGMYRLLSEKEMKQLQRDANRQLTLSEMSEEAGNVASIEAAEFDGMQCQKLRFLDEEAIAAYFSDETGLFAGMSLMEKNPMGAEIEQKMMFRDWKKVGDIRLAHHVVMTMPGMQADMKFTKVEFNKVDPTVFAVPEGVKAQLAGKDTPTTRPAGPATTAPDLGDDDKAPKLSAQMQAVVDRIAKIDDAGQLQMMAGFLEAQRASLSPEEQKELDFVLEKINARVAELEGDG
ncbi:MAG: hypothetical protein ACYTGP_03400 [Planctomycetota bacterium]|jgi:hypothetical protein